MKTSDSILDEYDFYARYLPGLWSLLPVGVAITAVGLRENPVLTGMVALLTSFGGPVVLARLVRNRGKAIEKELWGSWGGPPTTAMLRHRGDKLEAAQRQQLRDHVSEVLSITLPTEDEELEDPEAADAAYVAAIRRLRGLADDSEAFPLLFVENKNYGFERDLLAMRPIGLAVSVLCFAGLLAGLILSVSGSISMHWLDFTLAMVVVGVLIIYWLVAPTRQAVHRTAEAYADRLAQAAWKIGATSSTSDQSATSDLTRAPES